MKMSNEQNEYRDFVSYLDDTDIKRDVWVRVIEVNSFVRFELKSGKLISIPSHRVLKVKQQQQEGGDHNE